MTCTHDLADQETACACDGLCPICLAVQVTDLLAALREWKCPGCGGSGKYQQRSRQMADPKRRPSVAMFEPETICVKCGGHGLDVRAAKALEAAEVRVAGASLAAPPAVVAGSTGPARTPRDHSKTGD